MGTSEVSGLESFLSTQAQPRFLPTRLANRWRLIDPDNTSTLSGVLASQGTCTRLAGSPTFSTRFHGSRSRFEQKQANEAQEQCHGPGGLEAPKPWLAPMHS